jgi:hypothetical protein
MTNHLVHSAEPQLGHLPAQILGEKVEILDNVVHSARKLCTQLGVLHEPQATHFTIQLELFLPLLLDHGNLSPQIRGLTAETGPHLQKIYVYYICTTRRYGVQPWPVRCLPRAFGGHHFREGSPATQGAFDTFHAASISSQIPGDVLHNLAITVYSHYKYIQLYVVIRLITTVTAQGT